MVDPPDPTTLNAAHDTPVPQVTDDVATFLMPSPADPYNKLPAVKEV